jgi:D-alanyl-D-alanine carboxypeptidase
VDAETLESGERLEVLMGRVNNVTLFLREMNRLSWEVGMGSSNFANPHGLANASNYSTALDLCKLCAYAMKNPLFRAIVATQTHHYHYDLPLSSDIDKENQNPNIPIGHSTDKPVFSSHW